MRSPEAAAGHVLACYWDGGLPVNLTTLCRSLELELVEEEMSPPLVAVYDVGRIRLSASEILVRRRFAVAHALGHHILRHGQRADSIASYALPHSSWHEVSANRFALALLMPREALDVLMQSRKPVTVESLSRAFQVAEVAVVERLRRLRII